MRVPIGLAVILVLATPCPGFAQPKKAPPAAVPQQMTKEACEDVCNKAMVTRLDDDQKRRFNLCASNNLCPFKPGSLPASPSL